ncbi:MAG: hypothetical protein JST69_09540 [Bacteroidetes bacterium]|nr:hypothetical protein [Bacteroidota bacterium]
MRRRYQRLTLIPKPFIKSFGQVLKITAKTTPQLYTALPGETVGAIPVGMQSRYNEDKPYWPQFNTATYKEVWVAPAARWLSLISEF